MLDTAGLHSTVACCWWLLCPRHPYEVMQWLSQISGSQKESTGLPRYVCYRAKVAAGSISSRSSNTEAQLLEC